MISVHVAVREASASVEWDGDAGWHPEVANDMATRAVKAAVSAQHLAGEADGG